MNWPQFTTRELLWSFVLLAIGLSMLGFIFQPPKNGPLGELAVILRLAMFVSSGAFLGAGLMLPFKKTAIGAMIGPVALLLGFVLVVFAMS